MSENKKCRGAHGVVHEYATSHRSCPHCAVLRDRKRALMAGRTKMCRGGKHEYDATLRRCPDCHVLHNKKSYEANRQYHDGYHRKARTGWSHEAVLRAREEQQGQCAICRVHMDVVNKKALNGEHADHNHENGQTRALLCCACNLSLGTYEKTQRRQMCLFEPFEQYLFYWDPTF